MRGFREIDERFDPYCETKTKTNPSLLSSLEQLNGQLIDLKELDKPILSRVSDERVESLFNCPASEYDAPIIPRMQGELI